jgi:putative Mn2+ efflux pump MntP
VKKLLEPARGIRMSEQLLLPLLVLLIIMSRRIIYSFKSRRDSKKRTANCTTDIVVAIGCTVLLNPVALRYIFIYINIDSKILAFFYMAMLTAWFTATILLIRKELTKGNNKVPIIHS